MGEGLISDIIAYLVWILMSIVKFLLTPSAMIVAGNNWLEVIVTCSLGATIGILLFYNAGKTISSWWKRVKASSLNIKPPKKKRFVTKRKRQFIKFKRQYGLVGLMLISVFISVPITAFLGAKYFSHNRNTPVYLIAAFFVWGCVLTFLSWSVKSGWV
ncbi:MAG: hypothetical protein CL831_08085 [Crocinitomicaceae bacterium]|nr:hypothetical protein [Crocinitomicaceae bacterium]|tara:strand:- start:251 stop:724 length:474 start_codon:yes stop_codon:yes gene_type:complete